MWGSLATPTGCASTLASERTRAYYAATPRVQVRKPAFGPEPSGDGAVARVASRCGSGSGGGRGLASDPVFVLVGAEVQTFVDLLAAEPGAES